jgi:hypothetical protein
MYPSSNAQLHLYDICLTLSTSKKINRNTFFVKYAVFPYSVKLLLFFLRWLKIKGLKSW